MFRKLLDQAEAGDNIGALLVVLREKTSKGVRYWRNLVPLLLTPISRRSLRTIQRRRRKTYTILQRIRPQFYFRTTDVTGVVYLPKAWRW